MQKLKPGDPAPDFSGKLTDGSHVSLKDYRSKKLIMYFYPMDDTPGCTAQACSLRDANFGLGRAIRIAAAAAFGTFASDCFAPAPVYFDLGGVAFWIVLIVGYWIATPFLLLSDRGRCGLFWGWAIGVGYIALIIVVALAGKLTDGAFLAAPWFFIVPTVAAMLRDGAPKRSDNGESGESDSKRQTIIN